MRFLPKILFFALIFCSQFSYAQLFEYRHYSTKSGLPQSVVNSAAEDQFHQIWFSTYDGLSVFDGQNFNTITINQGLPVSVVINTVFFNNKIYSGLRGSLVEIDPDTKAVKVLAKVKENNDVGDCLAANGKIYFTSDSSLYEYENEVVRKSDLTSIQLYGQFTKLHRIGAKLFLATPTMVAVYNNETDFPNKPASRFPIKKVKSIFEFNGKIFAYGEKQLFELSNNQNILVKTFSDTEPIRNIIPYSKSILIGYGNEGLIILDSTFTKKYTFNRTNGLISNLIIRVFVDSSRNIWLLTEGAGVLLIKNIETLNFNRLTNFEVSFPYVLIQRNNNDIFVGAVGDGLSLVSPDGKVKQRWFKDKYVMTAVMDKKNLLWFDVQTVGLYTMDQSNNPVKIQTPDIVGGNIRSMKVDSKNRIWLASNYGIYRIENGKLTTLYDGPANKITPYFCDFDLVNDSTLVLASEVEGLFKFENGKLKHFGKIEKGQKLTSFKRVFVDSKNNLYAGSSDGVYKSTDYTTLTKIADSEKNNAGAVWGLMEDRHHRIWASASKGIFVISSDTDNTFLNEDFGLNPSEYNRFSLMEDSEGYVWAGSVDNLIKLNPNILEKIPSIPMLRIKRIISNKGLTEFQPTLNLERDVKWIQFELGLSDFTAREKVTFRYRALSRDSVWLPATKSSDLLLDNLTPGKTDLEISALDFLGRETNRIRISYFLPHPYWQSFWFISCVVLVVVLGVYNLYLFRLRILNEREKKLSELVHERTLALEENKRFVENLIDSATEIIFTTDVNGRIQIWNLEAQNFFGLSKEEIAGHTIDVIDTSDQQPITEIFKKVQQGKLILREKIEMKSRYSETGLILVSSYPMLDENGKVLSIVYILTDLKQHHLLESELLEKEKFIAGLDVLKNTLSTITHYINNSITAVLGIAEMAKTKEKYRIKLVEVAINQSLEIRAVIKSLENINSQLDFKTTEYPDLAHHIFDIKNEVEMHLQSYKDLTTKPDDSESV